MCPSRFFSCTVSCFLFGYNNVAGFADCRHELLCNATQVARVRSGVRALPQKTVDGAIPLAGKLPSSGNMHK